MFYVYLLISQKDGSKYIGQTDNLLERLQKHNSGKVRSTMGQAPWKMVKHEEFNTRSEARWREHTLKHNTNERMKFYGEWRSW